MNKITKKENIPKRINKDEVYPWQQEAWLNWEKLQQNQKLTHALLIAGQKGLGKYHFTRRIAHQLLCQKPPSPIEICNYCPSCQIEDLQQYPDFYYIGAEKEGEKIKIEAIRSLINALEKTSYFHNRVIVIDTAETLNTSAANGLLKLLEEPPQDCYFTLISSNPNQVPSTILSRCQKLKLYPCFDTQTVEWLAKQHNTNSAYAKTCLTHAYGSPQKAEDWLVNQWQESCQKIEKQLEQLLQQPEQLLNIAKEWQKETMIELLDQLLYLLHQASINKIEQPRSTKDNTFVKNMSNQGLMQFTRFILEQKRNFLTSPNLNKELLVENILISWIEVQ